METPRLSRRTFLRGLGVSIALPWLETMGRLQAGQLHLRKVQPGR